MKKNSLQQYIKSFLDIKKNQKIKNLIMIKKLKKSILVVNGIHSHKQKLTLLDSLEAVFFLLYNCFKQQHLGIGENLQFLDNR